MTASGNKHIVEALIFASDFPVTIKKICQIIDDMTEEEAEEAIHELQEDFEKLRRGSTIHQIAGGYEFVTLPEYALWARKLLAHRRRMRLCRASLETAAIVAYRQPVTRTEIEKIRGVDCGAPLRTLLARSLIKIAGREKFPGRPLIYATTEGFLRFFGVNSLIDLPQLEEIEDIIHHDAEKAGMALEQVPGTGGDSSSEEMRPAD